MFNINYDTFITWAWVVVTILSFTLLVKEVLGV